MADLLFNKKLFITVCALVVLNLSVNAYESSFPFPFEFGHSSDIYLNVKQPTKQMRKENQAAIDLLREKGISRSPKDFIKYIKKNNIEAVTLLLNAGFDPNTSIYTDYPVHIAAKYKKRKILYLLLKAGADPNKGFYSPLQKAVLNKDFETADLLIDFGADVNFEDGWRDETVLYSSLKKRQYDITKLLLKNNVKIDRKSYMFIKKKKLEKTLGTVLN